MKKGILSCSYRTKVVLLAIALAGGLLSGCYKNEGLDIIDPSGSDTPAPKYTITGSILDAETLAPIDGLTILLNGNAIINNNGSYTAAVKGGETNVITVSGNDYYEETTVSITVDKINTGQNVVYSRNIMVKPTMNGTWTVVYNITDINGTPLLSGTDYTFRILFGSKDVTTNINKLPAGSYTMPISGKGRFTNVQKIVFFELSKVRTSNMEAKYIVNEFLPKP